MDASLEGLKVISCWENGRGREFQSLDVIGIKELATTFYLFLGVRSKVKRDPICVHKLSICQSILVRKLNKIQT